MTTKFLTDKQVELIHRDKHRSVYLVNGKELTDKEVELIHRDKDGSVYRVDNPCRKDNPGNPGPGGDNTGMILLVVVGLAFLLILLWLLSQKKEEAPPTDGDDIDFILSPVDGDGDQPITGVYYDDFHGKATRSSWIKWYFGGQKRFVMSLHAEMRPGGEWSLWDSTILKIQYWDLAGARWRTLWTGYGKGQEWTVMDLAPQVITNQIRFKAEADIWHLVDWIDEVIATMVYSKV